MRPRPISSGDAEEYYYEQDPFFGAKINSQWQGRLAKKMSLEGPVKEEAFLNLVNGNDLKGQQVVKDGHKKNGEVEHRAGVDVPLAAPKSVSVLALHCGDIRLIEAHKKAVSSTVDYIEKHFLHYRRTIKGITKAKKINKGLFAKFDHSTSRANDPHLHTHTLTINFLDTKDGYRAVLNDRLFKYQTLLNSIYQSYLAKFVRDAGYGIEMRSAGKWEVAGFEDEWIKTFSKRKNEIDQAELSLKGDDELKELHEAKVRDMAQRNSRAKKDIRISKDELLNLWQGQVPRQSIMSSVEEKKLSAQQIGIDVNEVIRTAYNAIHESESTFDKPHTVDVALRLSRGKYTIDEIENAFEQTVEGGEIEHLSTLKSKLGLTTKIFTSAKMRQVEQGILNQFNEQADALANKLDQDLVDQFVSREYNFLNLDQRKMVKHIFLSPSRFSIIQGDAGTGKTTGLKAVKHLVDELNERVDEHEIQDAFILPGKKIEVVGLGFTGKAAKELEQKSGIKSQTLHKYLNRKESEIDPSTSSIWIVDESSMVGSLQMDELLKRAIEQNAKVVFIGDGKQLQAITAGKMFTDLQTYGHVHTLHMKDVLRQKSDHLIKVVGHIKNYMEGNDNEGIEHAFDVLQASKAVFLIQKKAELIQEVTDKFFEYEDQNHCLIATPLNEDRHMVNQLIHDRLQKKLNACEKTYNIKTSVSMVSTDRYYAANYKIGHKVFVGKSKISGLKAGQELTICALDRDKNTITVSNDSDDRFTINLTDNKVELSVYEQVDRCFMPGDKIVFTKNDELLDVQNGVTAIIERIDDNGMITAFDETGRHIKFNPFKFAYFDYGYCITGHKAQGQTSRDVIFFTSSGNMLNNAHMFYVAMTRAEHNAYIYINSDKTEVVLEELKRPQVKTSVLGALYHEA